MSSMATGVAVGIAVSQPTSGSIGPSLWMAVMIIAAIPVFIHLSSYQSLRKPNSFRNAMLGYGVFGILALVFILWMFPGPDKKAEPVISEQCQQTIQLYKNTQSPSQDLVHRYLKCEPGSGVGWLAWSFIGFVAVISIFALVMESRAGETGGS